MRGGSRCKSGWAVVDHGQHAKTFVGDGPLESSPCGSSDSQFSFSQSRFLPPPLVVSSLTRAVWLATGSARRRRRHPSASASISTPDDRAVHAVLFSPEAFFRLGRPPLISEPGRVSGRGFLPANPQKSQENRARVLWAVRHFRAMTAIAWTPVFPEAISIGALSALSRRSLFVGRPPALDQACLKDRRYERAISAQMRCSG